MADNPPESLDQMQARHRKEAKDLQGRVTSKKKNATKKTRKGVNDECAEMERQMRERQADEIQALSVEEEKDESIPDDAGRAPAAQNDPEAADEGNRVAEKLDGMKLGGAKQPPPPPPSQQPTATAPHTDDDELQGGGAGAGKKRNRQKERLARRAAEQEAAALAAEAEAANMTDHRAIEKTYMLGEFAKHGLEEHEIRPDGHCLFSAVADQLATLAIPLGGEGLGYKAVRTRAAEYIEAHGDEYAGFLEEDVGSYVKKMRDTAEWGGQLELAALANVYGLEIWVVQDRETEVVRPTAEEEVKGDGERKRIWLAFYRHGYGLGEHYNSLRKKV